MNFTNKVILITGAGSGMGAETARHLSRMGAKLSLTDRDETSLKQTVRDCQHSNDDPEPLYILGDLSKEKDIENIVKETIKHYKHLDVLVNSAGIGFLGDLESVNLEEYDMVQTINVRAVLLLTKLAMPHLIESKGNVVNVSSVSGLRPAVGHLSYNVSKAAVDQLTKCIALEVAPKQVRVNSVNPGITRTNFFTTVDITQKNTEEEYFERMGELYPIGRVGEAKDVAAAIAFLASNLASNITGVNLPVDGGISIADLLIN